MSYVSSSKMNAIATTIKGELDKKTPLTTVAPAYDSATVYKSGVLLTYNQKLYKCIKDATAGTLPTNTTYFKEVTVKEELDGKITFGSDWFDGSGSVHYAEEAGLAEGIATDRTIDNPEDSCPPITFGTVGGEAEIQTGINKFQTLFGNSFKYNQLVKNGNFENTDNWNPNTSSGTSLSVSNHTLSFSGGNWSGIYQYSIQTLIQNHKYLMTYIYKSTVQMSNGFGNMGGASFNRVLVPASDSFIRRADILTFTAEARQLFFVMTGEGNFSLQKVNVIDLTAMGITATTANEAIVALKALGIDVNQYLPYNESAILSSKSASLISRGFNQWDEEIEEGRINPSNGALITDSTYRRSKNFIQVIPGETYYFLKGNYGSGSYDKIIYYDANYQYVDYYDFVTRLLTIPDNVKYIKFFVYGTTYNHDICIFVHWDNTRNGEYVPYRSQTVTLPNIELRSVPVYKNKTVLTNEQIRDEAYASGGGKRKVGKYTFTGSESWTAWGAGYFITISGLNATQHDGDVIPNAISSAGNVITRDALYAGTGIGVTVYFNNIYVSNNTGLAGKSIQYELAEETDIPTSENPGWTENVYTDNWGTLEFTTDPVQNPQVPQPYFIEYTISLTEWVDSAYTRTSGDANTIVTEDELDAIRGGNDVVGKAKLADNLESNNKTALLSAYVFGQSPTGKADSMLMDKIVGGDVAYNQSIANGDFSEGDRGWRAKGALSVSNGIARVTATDGIIDIQLYKGSLNPATKAGHKYFVAVTVRTSSQSVTARLSTVYTGSEPSTNSQSFVTLSMISYRASDYQASSYPMVLVQNPATEDWVEVKNFQLFDLTQMFGSAIADYLYNLEQATPGAGVNKFRLLFPKPYYPYNAGELLPVRTVGRKAVGINLFDGDVEQGNLSNGNPQTASNRCRSKNFIRCIGGNQYYFFKKDRTTYILGYTHWYDGNQNFIQESYINGNSTLTAPAGACYFKFTMMHANTTSNVTPDNFKNICINISDPSINGTFYPYVENTYPVEDVALHGVFYLDSGNNIVTEGDEYTPDGKLLIKKSVVVYDGSSKITIDGTEYTVRDKAVTAITGITDVCFSFNISGLDSEDRVVCTNNYRSFTNYGVGFNNPYGSTNNFYMFSQNNAQRFAITLPGYTSQSAYDTAFASKPFVAVVTRVIAKEDSATPYASTQVKGTTQQWLEPEWTEEETPIMVPVGNQATLFDDLKKKVEIAADMPADDGTYVLNKSGGSNTYTPLETWLGNNGYNKMQVLLNTFGLKEALGGTLRQLLAVKESLEFANTAWIDLETMSFSYSTNLSLWVGYLPNTFKAFGKTMSTIYATSNQYGSSLSVGEYSIKDEARGLYVKNGSSTEKPKGLLAYEKASS